MNRLSTLVTLIVLAGIGWACAFAVIGFSIFARVPDNTPLALVFGAFGFVAGAACTAMRLVMASLVGTAPETLRIVASSEEPQPTLMKLAKARKPRQNKVGVRMVFPLRGGVFEPRSG